MARDNDQTDDIFDEGELEEDGTADVIRKAYDEMMKDEDDDGGFDQPIDESGADAPDVVSPDEGHDLLDKAAMAKEKTRKAELSDDPGDKTDPDPDKKTPDAEETTEKTDTAEDAPEPSGLETAALDALLDGVPDDRRGEISRRLDSASKILAPFEAHKEELERHGQTAEGAMNRLIDLNNFAQQKPDEYIAWVAKQVGSEPHKALDAAAKRFGYKLVRDADETDDDMFVDEETKRLREQNATLKAQLDGGQDDFGPDSPARAAERTLQSFVSEVDEAGAKRRPYFNLLQDEIAKLAVAEQQQTGRAVTTDDLDRLYRQVAQGQGLPVTAPQPAPATPQPVSAAQQVDPVADQIQKKAAAAQRAQRASKNVDGSGQGATRRPALSQDASLEDVLKHFASKGD